MKLNLKSRRYDPIFPAAGVLGTVYMICGPELNQHTPQIGIDLDQPAPWLKMYVGWENITNPERIKVGCRGRAFDHRYPARFVPNPLFKLRLKS